MGSCGAHEGSCCARRHDGRDFSCSGVRVLVRAGTEKVAVGDTTRVPVLAYHVDTAHIGPALVMESAGLAQRAAKYALLVEIAADRIEVAEVRAEAIEMVAIATGESRAPRTPRMRAVGPAQFSLLFRHWWRLSTAD